jgi:hypothetical protein
MRIIDTAAAPAATPASEADTLAHDDAWLALWAAYDELADSDGYAADIVDEVAALAYYGYAGS